MQKISNTQSEPLVSAQPGRLRIWMSKLLRKAPAEYTIAQQQERAGGTQGSLEALRVILDGHLDEMTQQILATKIDNEAHAREALQSGNVWDEWSRAHLRRLMPPGETARQRRWPLLNKEAEIRRAIEVRSSGEALELILDGPYEMAALQVLVLRLNWADACVARAALQNPQSGEIENKWVQRQFDALIAKR